MARSSRNPKRRTRDTTKTRRPRPGRPAPALAGAVVPPPSEMWRMLSVQSAPSQRLPKGLDAIWNVAAGRVSAVVPRTRKFMQRAGEVVALEGEYTGLDDGRLRERAAALREIIRLGRQRPEDMRHAFALVREVAFRTVRLRPYLEQVAAGLAMHDGCIAEMVTGEGKTLAATMPAVIAGWRGRGCHIITVNDYLASRDDRNMSPVYSFCGLRSSNIVSDMTPPQRRDAYLADVTYCTNKEVAADFLRDRLVLGRMRRLSSALLARLADGRGAGTDRLVMRGLDTAIVDEADSILIDEAVTPLIISGDAPNEEQVDAYLRAAEVARDLHVGRDYKINQRYREVNLTKEGKLRVGELCADLGGIWTGQRRREELLSQALTARELFRREKQYVLQEDKVVIVDEFTGRLMPDRTWRAGLHQAVEAKEGLDVQAPKETLARVSFQRFFRLYRQIGGMTGTAWEGRYELWQIYTMPTVVLPTHRPCIREHLPDRVYRTADAKWEAIVEEIAAVHAEGRPVLIGTRSVRASEHLSRLLMDRGLPHQVLNAVRHAEEAGIVAQAGQRERITVATNMAGRGTDIKLGRGVADLGGLHVIATERHEAGRIDRQLFGRAGRQGDPGSAVAFVSLEDELVRRHLPEAAADIAQRIGSDEGPVDSRAIGGLFNLAQSRAESLALRQRKTVLRNDDWLDEFLGFAGREM